MKAKYAIPLAGNTKGKRYYRVPVAIEVLASASIGGDPLTSDLRYEFTIIAKSAKEAANWTMDRVGTIPCVTVRAWGPKGGEVGLFHGWERSIGTRILADKERIRAGIEEVFVDDDKARAIAMLLAVPNTEEG